jgi:hypothetical protein
VKPPVIASEARQSTGNQPIHRQSANPPAISQSTGNLPIYRRMDRHVATLLAMTGGHPSLRAKRGNSPATCQFTGEWIATSLRSSR